MSYKNLILQTGRLDKNIEENLNFTYDGQSYITPLSSIALKKHLGEDKAKVILLYPVSLPFSKSFKNYKLEDPFYKDINSILNYDDRKEEYLKNPQALFDNHPHSKLVDVNLPIHAIGNYDGIEFKASIEDFILYILSYLIDTYLTNPFESLYIDITSGLNIYITTLLETAKYFQVWEYLYNLEKGQNINTFIVYSDPIIGSSKNKYDIYKYELKTKTFFSAPISHEDIEKGISKTLIEEDLGEDRSIKNDLNVYLKDFIILFSSLNNSAPLMLYNYELKDLENIRNFLQDNIIKKILSKYRENWIETFKIQHRNAINILLSIGFLMGIVKLLKSQNILKKEVKVNELELRIDNIYKHLKLGVQLSLLKDQIYKNFKEKKNIEIEKISKEFKKLSEYLKYGESNDVLDERNFFAHAGFERNVTLIRKNEKDEIILKYDDRYMDEIKKILIRKV